ncbi:hypothetical protein LTS18_000563 [Coniosporium uncinatum]|uniref:Uncharacterized protein n=1 Tax=Coniosporium uncinatum TaxID=93489 RepID=A0ACC3CUK7_9PEZI|nr:hypothetical protein LTS18_000563 [Coniosporium uncinatum]
MKLQAIYAILQRDASAIASVTIARPKDLANGTYGSYNARYEDAIVKSMISHDGGDPSALRIHSSSGKLDLFDAVQNRSSSASDTSIDATWIFTPWEGLEAHLNPAAGQDVKLHAWSPTAYGVPYGYSPVIARDASSTTTSSSASSPSLSDETLKKFIRATKKGYEHSLSHPSEAAEILERKCQPPRSRDFLVESQKLINQSYGGEGELGQMQAERWKAWVGWLEDKGLLEKGKVGSEESGVWTNEFFG